MTFDDTDERRRVYDGQNMGVGRRACRVCLVVSPYLVQCLGLGTTGHAPWGRNNRREFGINYHRVSRSVWGTYLVRHARVRLLDYLLEPVAELHGT